MRRSEGIKNLEGENAMERTCSRLAATVVMGLVGLLSHEVRAADDPGLKVYVEKRCYTCHTVSARAADVEK